MRFELRDVDLHGSRTSTLNQSLEVMCEYARHMPNVNSAVVGETVFLVSNGLPPGATEWAAYLENIKGHLARRAGETGRLLVFSGGGTPSSAQRLALRNAIDARPMKTAVVTDSAMVRGIIGVFSLFVAGTKPFATADWKAALEYVGFPLADVPALIDTARKLNESVRGSVSTAELLKSK
jgi:hypothetical protein